jgi:hypothetical protein
LDADPASGGGEAVIEELQLVLDSIGDISGVALWVVIGFLVYKIIIWSSTTGAVFVLTKLFIERLFTWLTPPPGQPRITGLSKGMIERLCITSDGTHEDLIVELRRLGITKYIHSQDVDWLREQINKRNGTSK